MNRRPRLTLRASFFVIVACAVPLPSAHAYIDFPPPTLGKLCDTSNNVYALKVKQANAEKGVVIFEVVEQLKGKRAFTEMKHVVAPKTEDAEVITKWATEGKTAVLFALVANGREGNHPIGGLGHMCVGDCWYSLVKKEDHWVITKGDPTLLTRYCGEVEGLREAVGKILAGEEVVVPCMVNDDKEALKQRRGKIHRLRASLRIKDYNPRRDFAGWGPTTREAGEAGSV